MSILCSQAGRQAARVSTATFVAFLVASAQSACTRQSRQVEARELGREVTVIGSLGVPLGKLVEIEGTMVERDYRRSKSELGEELMRVHKVDGNPLKEPVIISLSFFSFQDSSKPPLMPLQTYKFNGYETGGFQGNPDEVDLAVTTTVWYFVTDFQVVFPE